MMIFFGFLGEGKNDLNCVVVETCFYSLTYSGKSFLIKFHVVETPMLYGETAFEREASGKNLKVPKLSRW